MCLSSSHFLEIPGSLEEEIIQEETVKLFNSKELKTYLWCCDRGWEVFTKETKSDGGKIGTEVAQAEEKIYSEDRSLWHYYVIINSPFLSGLC